jgi:hypothetical protein
MRLEDALLGDLRDLVLEVFDGRTPPEGSGLLFGSASFLHKVSVTAYAMAWTSLVEMLKNKWKGVKVRPLIPIIRVDCPGVLARELQKLASWMVSFCQGNSLGLSESWSTLSALLIRNATLTGLLEHVDRYRTSLPADMSASAPLVSCTFVSTSSRPARPIGFGKVATNKLLCTVIKSRHKELNLCLAPKPYLGRGALTVSKNATNADKVVIVTCRGRSPISEIWDGIPLTA